MKKISLPYLYVIVFILRGSQNCFLYCDCFFSLYLTLLTSNLDAILGAKVKILKISNSFFHFMFWNILNFCGYSGVHNSTVVAIQQEQFSKRVANDKNCKKVCYLTQLFLFEVIAILMLPKWKFLYIYNLLLFRLGWNKL